MQLSLNIRCILQERLRAWFTAKCCTKPCNSLIDDRKQVIQSYGRLKARRVTSERADWLIEFCQSQFGDSLTVSGRGALCPVLRLSLRGTHTHTHTHTHTRARTHARTHAHTHAHAHTHRHTHKPTTTKPRLCVLQACAS